MKALAWSTTSARGDRAPLIPYLACVSAVGAIILSVRATYLVDARSHAVRRAAIAPEAIDSLAVESDRIPHLEARLDRLEQAIDGLSVALAADPRSPRLVEPVEATEAGAAALDFVAQRRSELEGLLEHFSEEIAWDRKQIAIRSLAKRLAVEHRLGQEVERRVADALFELSLRKLAIDQKHSLGIDLAEGTVGPAAEWGQARRWLEQRFASIVGDTRAAQAMASVAHVEASLWKPVTAPDHDE